MYVCIHIYIYMMRVCKVKILYIHPILSGNSEKCLKKMQYIKTRYTYERIYIHTYRYVYIRCTFYITHIHLPNRKEVCILKTGILVCLSFCVLKHREVHHTYIYLCRVRSVCVYTCIYVYI